MSETNSNDRMVRNDISVSKATSSPVAGSSRQRLKSKIRNKDSLTASVILSCSQSSEPTVHPFRSSTGSTATTIPTSNVPPWRGLRKNRNAVAQFSSTGSTTSSSSTCSSANGIDGAWSNSQHSSVSGSFTGHSDHSAHSAHSAIGFASRNQKNNQLHNSTQIPEYDDIEFASDEAFDEDMKLAIRLSAESALLQNNTEVATARSVTDSATDTVVADTAGGGERADHLELAIRLSQQTTDEEDLRLALELSAKENQQQELEERQSEILSEEREKQQNAKKNHDKNRFITMEEQDDVMLRWALEISERECEDLDISSFHEDDDGIFLR